MNRTRAGWTCLCLFATFATLVLGACQEPASLQCPSGLVCPAGQLCAAHQDVCIKDLCGDGKVDPGEVCDDGNIVDGDGCSANCHSNETCGNGVVDTTVGEICDPPGAACSADCRSGLGCGNGIRDPGEECDTGGATDTTTCDMAPPDPQNCKLV